MVAEASARLWSSDTPPDGPKHKDRAKVGLNAAQVAARSPTEDGDMRCVVGDFVFGKRRMRHYTASCWNAHLLLQLYCRGCFSPPAGRGTVRRHHRVIFDLNQTGRVASTSTVGGRRRHGVYLRRDCFQAQG